MQPISVTRYWEMARIEEERGPIYEGMMMLAHARHHLKQLPSSPENDLAIEQLGPFIGRLENQNKELAEKSWALWGQVLELDYSELRSEEIETQQVDAGVGGIWLDRVMKRVAETWPHEDGRDEILTELSGLRHQLAMEANRLEKTQREYQLKQAERLALKALGNEN